MSLLSSIAKRAASHAAHAAVDAAVHKVNDPAVATKVAHAVDHLRASALPRSDQLSAGVERSLDAAAQFAHQHAEAARQRAEVARQRLRLIGIIMAIAGTVGAILVATLVVLGWQQPSWNWLLIGKPLALLIIGGLVSIGALFHGLRSLATGRG